jgi:Lrp/AsnC family transcriptional regulator for asnA, asnC and gidA
MTSLDYLRHAVDLTPVDRAIVEILQRDGRRAYSQLAADVGVTEKTARRRVQSLLESGAIHITAVTDPRTLGYHAAALVGIGVDGSRPAAEVAASLTAIAAADYVAVTAGRYAIFLELFCRDMAHLNEVVDGEVRATAGVGEVELFPYLSLYYQEADLNVAQEGRTGAPGVRAVELEPLDRRIIWELTRDGRMPYQSIADLLEISETQVRMRVKRMTDAGAVRVIAIVNPLRYAYGTMGWLGVRAATGVRLQSVAEELARLPYVTYVAITTGSLDVFAEVVCRSQQEMLDLLDAELRRLPGIVHLEVFLYMDLHYKRLRPLPGGAVEDDASGASP